MLRAVFWFWSFMNTAEYRLTPAMKVQMKDYSLGLQKIYYEQQRYVSIYMLFKCATLKGFKK